MAPKQKVTGLIKIHFLAVVANAAVAICHFLGPLRVNIV